MFSRCLESEAGFWVLQGFGVARLIAPWTTLRDDRVVASFREVNEKVKKLGYPGIVER